MAHTKHPTAPPGSDDCVPWWHTFAVSATVAGAMYGLWWYCLEQPAWVGWSVGPVALWLGTNWAVVALANLGRPLGFYLLRWRRALWVAAAVVPGLWLAMTQAPIGYLAVLVVWGIPERIVLTAVTRQEHVPSVRAWVLRIAEGEVAGYLVGWLIRAATVP